MKNTNNTITYIEFPAADREQLYAAQAFYGAALGCVTEVLFETAEDGVTNGLTETYIRVYTDAPVARGALVPMRLVRLYRDGVWGTPVSKENP